jgi:hypothetical protein
MRIIIIIIMVPVGFGAAFGVLGILFLMMFSSSGDGVRNTTNTIWVKSMCWPSFDVMDRAGAVGDELDAKGVPSSDKVIKEIMERFDIVYLDKGTKVKINSFRVRHWIDNMQWPFYRVSPIYEPTRDCLVKSGAVEMEFYDWIKWQWNKEKHWWDLTH